MNAKKTVITGVFVIALLLTPTIATMSVYAASSTTNNSSNFFQGLVQFIAQKFGLDTGQVQNAVTDYRTQHMQQVQQRMQDNEKKHLDMLVSQGKITSSQEQQIIDEQNKLKSEYNMQDLRSQTPQQRKAILQKEKEEIQAWSKETGIDSKYLMPGFMRFRKMKMFDRWNMKETPASTTPVPSV